LLSINNDQFNSPLVEGQNNIEMLRTILRERHMLDEYNNLNLENASDEDFLNMFFQLKVFKKNKVPSKHTKIAYKQDLSIILDYLSRNGQTLKSIDFTVVKAFNQEMLNRYANRSAVRRLDFLRRILEFGYITHFYKTPLAPWIEKPTIVKGHYSDKKLPNGTVVNRTEYREMTEEEAIKLASMFTEVVRCKRYTLQMKARNNLIGQLLLLTGMRASEVLSLNWGSFRKNRMGKLVVDVIGKGKKERTIPVFDGVRAALYEWRTIMGESTDLDKSDTSPLFYQIEHFDQYLEKNRLCYTTLLRIVKSAVYKYGENDEISPHWFRHSFITNLLSRGLNLATCRQIVGHSSIATTNIYLERIQDDDVFDAFEKVGYK
jgi:integrase/recombinase XerD